MKMINTLIAVSLFMGATASLSLHARNVEIPTDISQNEKPATIKVLLAQDQEKILLEAKGSYQLYDPFSKLLLDGSSGKRQWISASENGLFWGDLIPGTFQVRIVPTNSNSSLLVNGIEYRGCIEVYANKGKLHIINEVDIERYLKSTMTSLFLNDVDDEVMDAVAITARTHAYYLVSRKPTATWHVEAQEVDYQGYALTMQNTPIERAINNTRFMAMTYQGLPFPATWTKDSGGKTADFATIFRKETRCPQGVESPYAAHNKQSRTWTFSISKQDLAKALGATRVSEFSLYQDNKSQKVYGARLKDDAQTYQFDFAQLQKALGNVRLKSNDFKVQMTADKVIFNGVGEGNGVGLCLFSANAMSDKGEKAPKILAAFFPEAKLNNIRSFEDMERMLISENAPSKK